MLSLTQLILAFVAPAIQATALPLVVNRSKNKDDEKDRDDWIPTLPIIFLVATVVAAFVVIVWHERREKRKKGHHSVSSQPFV